MNGFYEKVRQLLKSNGYTFLRQGNGAHELWANGKRHQVLSKNMPSRHMANAVLKQAGLKERI